MGHKEKKDQFIIAYLTDLDKTEAIINNAICFAKMLDKGLILLHISDKEYTNTKTEEAEEKLKELASNIVEIPFCSYLAIEGKSKLILHKISELLSGVLLVTSSNSDKPQNKKQKLANYPKELFKNLYESRVAYFIVDQNQKEPLSFDKAILTINNMRESKEKVLWGSYFGRFSESEIIVYYHNYKDEFHRHQLHYNIKFLMKMFDNFKINYKLKLSSNPKTYVDYQAIDYAREIGAGLVICQTTKDKDWTNSIFGLKELKTIENNLDIPILFVNPRNDLFILCE
ncbi:MAG: hypothetical protein WCR29_00785 [Bacteroidales bacterium]|nr:hypothetical protein [Bacteroidales bacterium]